MSDGKHEADEPTKNHFLSNKAYDVLKFTAQILLPALGTLYFAIAEIWHLPDGDEVVGSIVAVDAFLGAVLGFSTASYNKSGAKYAGVINVTDKPEGPKSFSLELSDDPYELDKKKEVLFKVNPTTNGAS